MFPYLAAPIPPVAESDCMLSGLVAGRPMTTLTTTRNHTIRPRVTTMGGNSTVSLELDDIQAAVLYPRPSPYVGTLRSVRIDDRARWPRAVAPPHPLSRLGGAKLAGPDGEAWAAVALSFQGLKALGVPEDPLATFPEFQQGMAARAAHLGDTGESAPDQWEPPLGSPDVHIVMYGLAPDDARLKAALDHARAALRDLSGVRPIWQQDTYQRPDERTRSASRTASAIRPSRGAASLAPTRTRSRSKRANSCWAIETRPTTWPPSRSRRCWAATAPTPSSASCTRARPRSASTCVRAPRTERRKSCWAPSSSGAGRAARRLLAPDKDDPELGADPNRNNAFMYSATTRGLKCPVGSHVRRMNPRDASIVGAGAFTA